MAEETGEKRMPKVLAGLGRFVDASRSAREFSPEARRGMLVIALAAIALLILAYVIFSWHSGAAEQLRQASAEHELVAARADKAARDGATRLTAATDVAPMFLDGATPGLSAAKFQGLAGDAATGAGLSVKRMQLVETGDDKAAAPFRISMDAEGSIEQLRSFLAAVEQSLPVMLVTGLEMTPLAAEGADDPYPSEALRMTVEIDAYGWRAAP